jgi:hypothetical protein
MNKKPQKAPIHRAQKRNPPHRSLIVTAVFIISGLSLLIASLFLNTSFSRSSLIDITRGRSGAFHGRHIKDPLLPPASTEITHTSTGSATITLTQPPETSALTLAFIYRCHSSCGKLWLDVITPGQGIKLLISHPVFNSVSWFFVRDGGINIFQKDPQFSSSDQVIAQIPANKILTEQSIIDAKKWWLPEVSLLEDIDFLSQQEFIVTSYEPPQPFNTWLMYAKTIAIPDSFDQSQSLKLVFTQKGSPSLLELAKFTPVFR